MAPLVCFPLLFSSSQTNITLFQWQGVYYGVAMGSGNLGMVTVLYFGGQYVNQVRGCAPSHKSRTVFSAIFPAYVLMS